VGAEAPRAAQPTDAPADGNVAVGSHGEYFPTLTAAAAKLESNHHTSKPTPNFLQAGCPSCRPTDRVKALSLYYATDYKSNM